MFKYFHLDLLKTTNTILIKFPSAFHHFLLLQPRACAYTHKNISRDFFVCLFVPSTKRVAIGHLFQHLCQIASCDFFLLDKTFIIFRYTRIKQSFFHIWTSKNAFRPELKKKAAKLVAADVSRHQSITSQRLDQS